MLFIRLIVPGCVLQQQRYQAGRVVGACWLGVVFLELPQAEFALEIGLGYARQQHLGLADRSGQLGFPFLSQPQVVTVEEQLFVRVATHLEIILGRIPQCLHQAGHPLPGIVPAGVADEHRIPTRRCGVLRVRWWCRHGILLTRYRSLRTSLTDRTFDRPG